jgi:hypothetical protein
MTRPLDLRRSDVTSSRSPKVRRLNVQMSLTAALAHEHLKMAMQVPAGRSTRAGFGRVDRRIESEGSVALIRGRRRRCRMRRWT